MRHACNHARPTSVVNKRVNNAASNIFLGPGSGTFCPLFHSSTQFKPPSTTHLHPPSSLAFAPHHQSQTPFLLKPPRKDESRSVRALFPHLLSPQRSKRPLLVFLSARRKAFEKKASCTEQSSTWTLTPEFRSRSASSRRRTGATPPKQPPRLTSRERSTFHKHSSASDGRNNTPLFLPLYLLVATNSARKKFTSPAKRIVNAVRAAEKTSTSVKIAGQYTLRSISPIAFLRLQSRPSNEEKVALLVQAPRLALYLMIRWLPSLAFSFC